MKNIFFILLSAAGLATFASAASSPSPSEVYQLPTYVVTAPRFEPAEQKVRAGLEAFVRQAEIRKALAPDLEALRVRAERYLRVAHGVDARASQPDAKS